jgi:hypothetical protein
MMGIFFSAFYPCHPCDPWSAVAGGERDEMNKSPNQPLYASGIGATGLSLNHSAVPSLGLPVRELGRYAIDNIVMQPVPSLAIQSSQTNLLLSWPTKPVGFSVQRATNLTAAEWSDVTNALTTVGTHYSMTLDTTQQMQFFRLKH